MGYWLLSIIEKRLIQYWKVQLERCNFGGVASHHHNFNLYSHMLSILETMVYLCRLGIDDGFDIKEQHYNLEYLC